MTKYSFKEFSILVVDDSEFILSLLGSTLKTLGVGFVDFAADGKDAINHLKFGSRVFRETDIVISDLNMEFVDGLTLLRWVRRHEESPNHFLPFLLVSAFLDESSVRDARNLGVNGFITKPFTVDTLSKQILELIERPRQFVRTKMYFGPDRRTRKRDVKHMERRALTEVEGEEVWDPDNPDLRFFRLPNLLKAKALGVIASEEMEDGDIDPAALVNAEGELSKWTEDYADWAREFVSRLAYEYKRIVDPENEETDQALRAVGKVATEIKAQAPAFDYQLMAMISKSLASISCARGEADKKRIKLIKSHIDALHLVIKNRIKGDGGPVGKALIDSLQEADEILGKSQAVGGALQTFLNK